MSQECEVALIYGAKAGIGGLGHSVASAITALAGQDRQLLALGPGYAQPWSLPGGVPNVRWITSPQFVPAWKTRYTPLRWRSGELAFRNDRGLGQWASKEIERLQTSPHSLYTLTQVGLEALRWARPRGVFTGIDNPNGHIRNFREILERESERWCGTRFQGHPTPAMVERVEEEYELAAAVRVYSEWGRRSMSNGGVPAHKLAVARPTINRERFRPSVNKPASQGPLRLCYVGSLDLRKGFVYLLRAIRALGARHVELEIVGATGDRDCAKLFARERQGLTVRCAAGDPIRAYQESEVFVLPTLEDGFGFVVPEAMACGLPVIISDQCGAGECVTDDNNGWVTPAGSVEQLAAAIEKAIDRRAELPEMGLRAQAAAEQYCGPAQLKVLADWFYGRVASGSREAVEPMMKGGTLTRP